jgi:multiple sugar transport system ATP-binding protein
MARVELDNLTKVYDDAQGTEVAVEELDVTFEDGEFVVILGPSGCGKSTTLRMIAGLEDITQGRVLISDEDVTNKKPKDRDVALVFQNYALYPHKTVRQNIGYGLKVRTDLTDEEINERVEQTAEMMGIEELLDKKPSALSGGQQQRVATGRAIVREPAVFLFDEPLSNLDAKLRKHLRTELARLHSQLGITSIYVTHNQEEAMTLGDTVLILNDGRVQQMATPLEIYHNPRNRFVADFIGSPSMNFFEVEFEATDVGGRLVHADWSYALSPEFVSNIEVPRDRLDGKPFILGVRPEHLQIADEKASERTIPATVDVVETMGVDNYVYLQDDDEFVIRTSPEINPESGESLDITFDESEMVLFDVETEENVLKSKTKDVIEEQP